VQLALRIAVTRNAFVRSTSLFDRNNLYCTSLFGNFDEPVDARDYTDGQLWLMDGNSVTPGHPLLVYRVSQGDRGAIATVDGSHLLTALRLIAQDEELLVRVGDALDGPGWPGAPRHTAGRGQRPRQLSSTRYPFSVQGGYAAGKLGS
jgi:hypothetical protein